MCVPCRIGDKSNRAVLFSLGRPRRRNRRLLRFFLSVTVTWQLWHYLWHDFTILICFALPLHKYTTTAHRWLTGTVYNWQFTGAQQSTALCHLETRLSITFTFFAHCPSADSGWISAVHYKALLLQVTLVNRLLDGWPTEGWLRIMIVVARAINHPGGWPIGCCVDRTGKLECNCDFVQGMNLFGSLLSLEKSNGIVLATKNGAVALFPKGYMVCIVSGDGR